MAGTKPRDYYRNRTRGLNMTIIIGASDKLSEGLEAGSAALPVLSTWATTFSATFVSLSHPCELHRMRQ